jgi:peptidyl-tRNA hydrolase
MRRYVRFIVALLMGSATLAAACADATTNIFEAILHDNNTAHQSAAQHEATQQKLLGLMDSACNIEQYGYFALEVSNIFRAQILSLA